MPSAPGTWVLPLAAPGSHRAGCTARGLVPWPGAVSPPSGRLRRVAVLVLEGAKPLDVGIPAQVFTTRASTPCEVRVCGAAPGLVAGADGLSCSVADGLDALGWAHIVFIPGHRNPDRDDPRPAVVEALLAAHERGTRLAAISTAPSPSPPPACSTAATPRSSPGTTTSGASPTASSTPWNSSRPAERAAVGRTWPRPVPAPTAAHADSRSPAGGRRNPRPPRLLRPPVRACAVPVRPFRPR